MSEFMKTQTVTTTEEWLLAFHEFGKPQEIRYDDEAEAMMVFNHKQMSRNVTTLMLYNITTQTTKTLQRRY